MQVPLEITFRGGVEHNPAIEDLIRRKTQKMDQFCDHVSSCHVAIETTQRHQERGNTYRVRLDISVPPGHKIFVERTPSKGHMHDPLTTTIRGAFKAAYRQVRDLSEKQNREIKSHPDQTMNAVVSKIKKSAGYGFLRSFEGREIYFHRHSVINVDFNDLMVGDGIHYIEEIGNKGAQASSVHLVNRTNL
ncbi:MAG: HPF/RaiA family ribosome-associated protein [Candidatus Omnitrophota bacterium]